MNESSIHHGHATFISYIIQDTDLLRRKKAFAGLGPHLISESNNIPHHPSDIYTYPRDPNSTIPIGSDLQFRKVILFLVDSVLHTYRNLITTDKTSSTMSTEATPPVVAVTEPAPAVETPKPVEPEAAAIAATPEKSQATPEKVAEEKSKAAETPIEKVPEKTVETPLQKLTSELPAIIKEIEHDEMWGVTLSPDPEHVPTSIILEKFLRANNKVVVDAITQLKKALKWRKEMKPLALLADVSFDKAKFGDLGFVTVYPQSDGLKEIVTWNVYGAVKDNKATFGNVEE